MTPNPSHCRSLTAYRLAQAQHAEAVAFWRTFRRWLALSLTAALLIAAACRWPGAALAVVCLGSPSFIIAAAWLSEARAVSREHDEEQNL